MSVLGNKLHFLGDLPSPAAGKNSGSGLCLKPFLSSLKSVKLNMKHNQTLKP